MGKKKKGLGQNHIATPSKVQGINRIWAYLYTAPESIKDQIATLSGVSKNN